jgi:hypothetical protein
MVCVPWATPAPMTWNARDQTKLRRVPSKWRANLSNSKEKLPRADNNTTGGRRRSL